MRGWVDERRDDLRLLHQLRTQAEEWRKSGGKEKYRWPHERVRDAAQALARLRQDEYDLRLMSVKTTDELVDDGHWLVIVGLVGTDLHIRIFDRKGEKVVDKAENKLVS